MFRFIGFYIRFLIEPFKIIVLKIIIFNIIPCLLMILVTEPFSF